MHPGIAALLLTRVTVVEQGMAHFAQCTISVMALLVQLYSTEARSYNLHL
jgi:hypothetical protein